MKKPRVDRATGAELKGDGDVISSTRKHRVAKMQNTEPKPNPLSFLTEQARDAKRAKAPSDLTIHVGQGGNVTLVLGYGCTTVVQTKP